VRHLEKAHPRKLRTQGLIPAVIYGGKQNANITINAREFNKKFKVISESTMINLEGEGLKFNALIKDYQENVMRGEVTHIDFVEVVAGSDAQNPHSYSPDWFCHWCSGRRTSGAAYPRT
jgi:large subunit ribosomal protein L25